MRILEGIKEEFGSFAEARQAALSGKADDLARVISFLLKEEEWKAQFFVSAGGAMVFNKERFLELLENRELDSSYTKFSNKIGLGFKGKSRFLKAVDDVVLSFPYKDCVLKGAQGEDGAKTRELFFNEILAASEIDALFRPKALCNFELVSSEGERSVNLLDELRSSRVNLLIKGNNLLALHTLKRRRDICGNVKLIYIDPPYNTGSDSFNYNDRFGHSTWLAFMKNRLEVAREFLRDDGVIFIQCDDNEQAYLKVLCDEIFGRESFVACFAVQHNPRGRSLDRIMAKTHEYILCFAKNISKIQPFLIQKSDEAIAEYSHKDENGLYREMRLMNGNRFFTKEERPNLYYPIYVNPDTLEVSLARGNDFDVEVFPVNSLGSEQCWTWSKDKFEQEKHLIVARQVKNEGWRIYRKDYLGKESSLTKTKSLLIDKAFNNENGTEELRNLGIAFSTPKPEALLKRIIEISTSEGDIVMDFFAGSGTTLAVAHKMHRRWVGVEQMGYIGAITKERLKKVVAGEQGGVSKATGWQGGGRFVYAELAPLNAAFKEKIAVAGEEELAGIYREMEERAFLDYRVDLPEMLNDDDWASLPLEEKKRALFDALDGNMDYVLLSDLDDEDSGVDGETRECNRAFFM